LSEYFTEKSWRKFLDTLTDILWEAKNEGIIPDSLPIIEDIDDRITPQVKAKVLTKSEVMDEVKKILEERGGASLISWLRSKYGELSAIEKMMPPSLTKMYAEAEQKIKELEKGVKKLKEKKIAPTEVRGLEEQIKELKKQVEEKEIKLREAEQEIARLKQRLEKYEPYLPGEVVYVHIERGWPIADRLFEFVGAYKKYVASICDIIEVDKKDFESESFQKLVREGIVKQAIITPEQAEKIKDEVERILKERDFKGGVFDAVFREVISQVDWSRSYEEVLKEATARARTISPVIPPPTAPTVPKELTEVIAREVRRAVYKAFSAPRLKPEDEFYKWVEKNYGYTPERFIYLPEEDRKKIREEFVKWKLERRR